MQENFIYTSKDGVQVNSIPARSQGKESKPVDCRLSIGAKGFEFPHEYIQDMLDILEEAGGHFDDVRVEKPDGHSRASDTPLDKEIERVEAEEEVPEPEVTVDDPPKESEVEEPPRPQDVLEQPEVAPDEPPVEEAQEEEATPDYQTLADGMKDETKKMLKDFVEVTAGAHPESPEEEDIFMFLSDNQLIHNPGEGYILTEHGQAVVALLT